MPNVLSSALAGSGEPTKKPILGLSVLVAGFPRLRRTIECAVNHAALIKLERARRENGLMDRSDPFIRLWGVVAAGEDRDGGGKKKKKRKI